MLAVGFLLLDGVLLLLIGLWSPSPRHVVGGAVCLVLAGGVVLLWRRQRRLQAELAAARAEVRDEARALRDLLRG